MSQLFISFIIPVLNAERYIGRCLKAIQKQTCLADNFEIIVVDNGSKDRTTEIVREFRVNLRMIRGASVAALRNAGAMNARGEYFAFVDADVELAPDWLRNGLATLENRNVVAIGGPRGIPDGGTWVQRTWGLHLETRRPKKKAAPVAWLYSMAFIVRKDEFSLIGGFNEELESGEDVDLCYRLAQRGTILYNPTMKAVHWGEDPDVRTFWQKEVWRGTGNFKGVIAHGLRWDELPSIGYPMYILVVVVLTMLGIVLDLGYQRISLTLFNIGLLILPALMLAVDTTRKVRHLGAFPRLFLLYLLYGFARAYSMLSLRVSQRV